MSLSKGGVNDPNLVQVKDNGSGSTGVYTYQFDNNTEEELFFAAQIPHAWKEGSNIYPHVHWYPTNTDTGNVIWGLEYTWANVNGTFGRGNVGTDLNGIPAFAINNVQVLRDGAAAQYGSDAIAGVMDLGLKSTVNELGFSFTTGGNFTSNIGPFNGEEKSVDGEVANLAVNYGLPLGEDGGFINMTGEFNYRGPTNRMQDFIPGKSQPLIS